MQKKWLVKKEIEKEGNCYYRALCYFYRDTEEDHMEIRSLIISYIGDNIKHYVEYIADEEVTILKKQKNNDEFKIKKKTKYLNKYIKEAIQH